MQECICSCTLFSLFFLPTSFLKSDLSRRFLFIFVKKPGRRVHRFSHSNNYASLQILQPSFLHFIPLNYLLKMPLPRCDCKEHNTLFCLYWRANNEKILCLFGNQKSLEESEKLFPETSHYWWETSTFLT